MYTAYILSTDINVSDIDLNGATHRNMAW
jgi:hypothetical protein